MNKKSTNVLKSLIITLLIGQLLWINNALAEIKLSFGVYTSDKPTVVVKKFKPLLKSLESSLAKMLQESVRIKLQVASTYAGGIKDISAGKVDFSRLGPASYIQAKHQQPRIQILALEAKDGKKRFNGVIAVKNDSMINQVIDLRGKSFAFGDESSTIGRFLAQKYLSENGIKESDLSHYDYLGRHDRVGAAVDLGKYDAGALKQSTYNRLVEDGASLRIIATFTNVTKPWIARKGLDDEVFSALREALLEIKDPVVLKALEKDGFVQGKDDDYEVIRHSIEQNSAFFN